MPNRFRRPDPDGAPIEPEPTVPPGIAALLDSIDGEERELHREQTDRAPAGPGAQAFAEVLYDLTANLAVDPPVLPRRLRRPPAVPQPLRAPGDLIVVIGAAVDAVAVARSMAVTSAAGDFAVAGMVDSPGTTRVDDRRSAVRARAIGVHNARPVFVAFGLDRRTIDRPNWDEPLLGISPDQVWVAVDAGRKPEDTAHWVNAVAARIPVDAIAVEGSTLTASPDTVDELHLPIGWVDGSPSASARAARPIWDS
jgi:hypothetical protein